MVKERLEEIREMGTIESTCTYCVHRGVCKYESMYMAAEQVHAESQWEHPIAVKVTCKLYKAGDAGTLHR